MREPGNLREKNEKEREFPPRMSAGIKHGSRFGNSDEFVKEKEMNPQKMIVFTAGAWYDYGKIIKMRADGVFYKMSGNNEKIPV